MRTEYEEATASPRTAEIPMAHLSIELGHLYMDDFAAGPDRLRAMAQRVAGWATTARADCAARISPQRPRISTCFLIDDYFTTFSSPAKVLPALVEAAAEAGLEIDYVARESACAQAGTVPLAELVAGRLVPDPPPATNGSRPPVQEIGWLCNGERSDPLSWAGQPTEAMAPTLPWSPPRENAVRNHSIVMDVELWRDGPNGGRGYACAFLAAVWQLLRLGVLRFQGQPVVVPEPAPANFPDRWVDLAPLTKLRPDATPFAAYWTHSVLSSRFLTIEAAVRMILNNVAVDVEVTTWLADKALVEGVRLAPNLLERVGYSFFGEG